MLRKTFITSAITYWTRGSCRIHGLLCPLYSHIYIGLCSLASWQKHPRRKQRGRSKIEYLSIIVLTYFLYTYLFCCVIISCNAKVRYCLLDTHHPYSWCCILNISHQLSCPASHRSQEFFPSNIRVLVALGKWRRRKRTNLTVQVMFKECWHGIGIWRGVEDIQKILLINVDAIVTLVISILTNESFWGIAFSLR